MNITEIFSKQIAEGAGEKLFFFFYGIETMRDGEVAIEIRTHKGSLDTFPDLTYVSHMTDAVPLFRS